MNANNRKIQDQFKYYTFLSVVYAILMVTAQAVAYRFIEIGSFLEPGGIFIFPATFAINDVIAEVYGPTLARRSIFFALFAQAFYSFIPIAVNSLPYPVNWHHLESYHFVFSSSWLVFLSNLIAVLVGMVLNTQIIAKTKLVMKGSFFSLRSLFSSAIGEFVLTALIVLIALMPKAGFDTGIKLFWDMFLFKLIFSFIAVYPASILVVILKRLDQVDIYEKNIKFNPLSYFIKTENTKNTKVVNIFNIRKKRPS